MTNQQNDNITLYAKNIGYTSQTPFHAHVAVYKLAATFLSCRAASFVTIETMRRFGVTVTGGNAVKHAEHVAKYGEGGSAKAQRVLAVFSNYTLDQLLELTPNAVIEQLPKSHFQRLIGVAIVGAGWAEHYGYAQVAESTAMAHYDSSANAAPAKEVLTAQQLEDAKIYGLTDPNELVWFRSSRDHGIDF